MSRVTRVGVGRRRHAEYHRTHVRICWRWVQPKVMSARESAAVLALVAATGKGGEWSRTATLIDDVGSALALVEGRWEIPPFDVIEAERLSGAVTQESLTEFEETIRGLQTQGIAVLTVLDPEYPVNLRAIYNRPPFLTVRGTLHSADQRSIAVVGTRRASPQGLDQARALACDLAGADVTVLSGLALGVDGAAHTAALDTGGRTVAVMGTGINRVYPADHRELARRIVESGQGALVSQFWPDAPPTRYSFPMRNIVMSGMAVGTVVIEASKTSGAKMQARLALEHGKRLFLVESLVMQEPWAQDFSRKPGVTVVRSATDVLDVLVELAQPVEQLTLT